jgi:hypothetical protein
VTTLPRTVVTLYLSVLQGDASKVTRVTTLLILFNFLKKGGKKARGRAWFIPIAERKRKQPNGVVTVVTFDANICQASG